MIEPYYFKTRGQEPDEECIEKCQSKLKPSAGVHIGSITCQECVCCVKTDKDKYGNVSWIKCTDIANATQKKV